MPKDPLEELMELIAEPQATVAAIPQPEVTSPPRPAGRGRINLGGIKTAEPKKGTRTEYPHLPDTDGTYRQMVDERFKVADQIDNLEGKLKQIDGLLKEECGPLWWSVNHNRPEPVSSIAVTGTSRELLIQHKRNSKLVVKDTDSLVNIIGRENLDRYFKDTFTLAVDSEQIPANVQQQFVDELAALADRYGCASCLSVKSECKPTKEWDLARHSLFDPTTNLRIETVAKCVTTAATEHKGK